MSNNNACGVNHRGLGTLAPVAGRASLCPLRGLRKRDWWGRTNQCGSLFSFHEESA